MKATKIMLAFIGTLLLTWLFLGTMNYLLSGDLTFRESVAHGGIGMMMLIFGWIPSVVVSIDLDTKLS